MSATRRTGSIWTRALALIAVALLLAACSAPESNDDDDRPTPTATAPAITVPTSTATPTAEPAAPSPTQESPTPTPTDTPPPPVTEPTATPTPTSPPEPTPTPEPTATATMPAEPPGAEDVWNLRQFETDQPVMVLTFDAGADRGFAEEILDILAAEGIRASFGMTGPWAVDNMDLVARMVNEGHHVMNHSWSHPHFPELTTAERTEEVRSLENLLRDELGIELQPYFRPPFGEYDEATLADLAAMGYTVNVLWTVDTLGWNGLSAAEINQRVLDAAAPGAIVLMHVGGQSQDAAALPEMISLLRAQGYSFATIEELAGL